LKLKTHVTSAPLKKQRKTFISARSVNQITVRVLLQKCHKNMRAGLQPQDANSPAAHSTS